MREAYFIVNWGHGWYEFDAALCWRGPLAVRRAYIREQRVRDGLTILDRGKVVSQAEDVGDIRAHNLNLRTNGVQHR
jgi:hypothetical protein